MKRRSPQRCSINPISLWFGPSAPVPKKHFERSAVSAQKGACTATRRVLRAEWQLFPGLKPCEQSKNIGSYMASRIILTASSTILSANFEPKTTVF